MNRVPSFIALVILFSCSTTPKDEITVISRAFTSVDADRKIMLSRGRSFEIKLPRNPETGYDWILNIDNPEVVSSGSNRYTADRSGRTGLGGETMWSLRTRATGDAVLTYSYQNASNTRTPASRTVTFTIGVR